MAYFLPKKKNTDISASQLQVEIRHSSSHQTLTTEAITAA